MMVWADIATAKYAGVFIFRVRDERKVPLRERKERASLCVFFMQKETELF